MQGKREHAYDGRLWAGPGHHPPPRSAPLLGAVGWGSHYGGPRPAGSAAALGS